MLREGLFPAHPCLRYLYSESVTGSAVLADVSGLTWWTVFCQRKTLRGGISRKMLKKRELLVSLTITHFSLRPASRYETQTGSLLMKQTHFKQRLLWSEAARRDGRQAAGLCG